MRLCHLLGGTYLQDTHVDVRMHEASPVAGMIIPVIISIIRTTLQYMRQ